MWPYIKRLGEVAASVTAIAVVLTGILSLFGASIPPWTTAAQGQKIIQKIDQSNAFADAIALDVLDEKLDRAWARYRSDHNDLSAVDDIRRLNRQIKKIDPSETLNPPPE